MSKIIKGRYIKGSINLLENTSFDEGEEVFIISQDKKSVLEETFGIWEDSPDFLEKLRENGEKRMRELKID